MQIRPKERRFQSTVHSEEPAPFQLHSKRERDTIKLINEARRVHCQQSLADPHHQSWSRQKGNESGEHSRQDALNNTTAEGGPMLEGTNTTDTSFQERRPQRVPKVQRRSSTRRRTIKTISSCWDWRSWMNEIRDNMARLNDYL